MVILNFLRALVDLGFYYSIAGMFSAAAGGLLALEILLLQSACFALSFALRRSRAARLAAVLPALAPALLAVGLPIPLPDAVLSLPPVIYLAYLAWTDGYQLSRNRQADLFHVFWRAFLVMAGVLTLMNSWQVVLTVGIPAALMTAAASVLMMRSLRHEPSVYLQPSYQAVNAAGILLLALAALVLGSEWVMRTVLLVAGTFYNYIVAPLLLGVFALIGFVLLGIAPLIAWFLRLFRSDEPGEMPEMASEEGFQEQMDKMEEMLPSFSVELILQILLSAIVLVTLFLVFRWMSRRWNGQTDTAAPLRVDIPARQGERARPGTYAYRIRKQYRAFLRLCRTHGLQFPVSDTSTDVGRKSLGTFPDEEAMAGLRDLYQQARYQGEATREDYQQFKKLLGALKKAQDQKARGAGPL